MKQVREHHLHFAHRPRSLGTGFLVTALVFVFWRPQQHVFLDRICITESDPQLKAEQILSLAGMLKRSREMLVLWDSSWSDRLWCLFELSAFLKSKADSEHSRLLVTPTFMGPCVVATFLGMFLAVVPLTTFPLDASFLIPMVFVCVFGAFGALCCAHAFRSYFQSVDDLKEKLQSVNLERTRSICCDLNHEGDMTCDREIVKDCITIWFGSQEAFEDCVRSEVLETLTSELEQSVFTRPWRIAVTGRGLGRARQTLGRCWASFSSLAASFVCRFHSIPRVGVCSHDASNPRRASLSCGPAWTLQP